ncbi:MAG: phosphohydrolase [Candidatus Aenigmatarchaeota archaeon]|nr:MAG: phosphohydrolase [Candidatus Aenigmarchaeota archaeon]
MLEFFETIGKLKDIRRTGWVIKGVENPETVAEHTFRLALMSMIYGMKLGLNVEKMVKMALIHDIGEVHTKDIPTRFNEDDQPVTNSEKRKLEEEGTKSVLSLLPKKLSEELFKLWFEFENKGSEEARLVHDLDKVEMVLQALEYRREHNLDLDEFFMTADRSISHPLARELFSKIKKEYERVS